MKYYKFLGNGVANIKWSSDKKWVVNKIYSEDFKVSPLSLKEHMKYTATHKYFQEVPKIEYLLQKAVEDYPKGTIVYDAYDNIERVISTKQWVTPGDNDWIEGIYYKGGKDILAMIEGASRGVFLYHDGKWAEKVEKFTLPEKWCIATKSMDEEIKHWFRKKTPYLTFGHDYYGNCPFDATNNKNKYGGLGINRKTDHTEITFHQFKKYILNQKEEMENKELIGYKLNGTVSKEIADRVLKWTSTDYDGLYFIKGHLAGSLVQEAKRLEILDKWFTPVYQDIFIPDITINGYNADFKENYVKFGCAKIAKEIFQRLYNEVLYFKPINSNREVESVKIGTGEFTKEQIKEIVEYYKNK